MNPQIYQIKLTDPLKSYCLKRKKHKIHMKISTKVGMVSIAYKEKKFVNKLLIFK